MIASTFMRPPFALVHPKKPNKQLILSLFLLMVLDFGFLAAAMFFPEVIFQALSWVANETFFS